MQHILQTIGYLENFNISSVLVRLFLSVLLGGIIGNERGRHGSPAGFRTHILVCLGATMTSLCELYEIEALRLSSDASRLSAQVISGIGFLGAGIILIKNNNTIAGLTTAAGMWVTAVIGIVLGYGFYGCAVVATLICFCTAAFLTKIEHRKKKAIHFYMEITDYKKINSALETIESLLNKDMIFEILPAKSGTAGHVGINVTMSDKNNFESIKDKLQNIDGIGFLVQG